MGWMDIFSASRVGVVEFILISQLLLPLTILKMNASYTFIIECGVML